MTDTAISSVHGRRIWDSRGRPTVEVEITLSGGASGRGIAPAGASRGQAEAVELRDGGKTLGGFGVAQALGKLSEVIAPALIGQDATDQRRIDQTMLDLDGTPAKENLGGNTIVAASLAALHASAAATGEPLWRYLAGGNPVSLPLPEIQIFGGGAHAGRRVDIQDFMIMPLSAESFDAALEMTSEVYRAAGDIMDEAGKRAGVADEGGWWPDFSTNEEALEMLVRAIDRAGYTPGAEVGISLDIAASEFYRDGTYRLGLESRELNRDGMIDLLARWIDRFPIVSVEDPLSQDDRDGMRLFTETFGRQIQIIGDDYLVTNAGRIEQAVKDGACNAALIKFNQAGTVSETQDALEAAKAAKWGTVISARSGETEDVTITHLAVGWNAGQLKVGSFARSERMAKWNEGLRIAEQLGDKVTFAGRRALPPTARPEAS